MQTMSRSRPTIVNKISPKRTIGSNFSMNSMYLIVLSVSSLLARALFRALYQVVCPKQVRDSRVRLRMLCRSHARIYKDSFTLEQMPRYLLGDSVVLSTSPALYTFMRKFDCISAFVIKESIIICLTDIYKLVSN